MWTRGPTSSIVFNFWAVFYVFFNSSWSYLLQIWLGLIRIRIKKATGSGSALRRTAGSGSAKNKCGSTAPPPAKYSKLSTGKRCCWNKLFWIDQDYVPRFGFYKIRILRQIMNDNFTIYSLSGAEFGAWHTYSTIINADQPILRYLKKS